MSHVLFVLIALLLLCWFTRNTKFAIPIVVASAAAAWLFWMYCSLGKESHCHKTKHEKSDCAPIQQCKSDRRSVVYIVRGTGATQAEAAADCEKRERDIDSALQRKDLDVNHPKAVSDRHAYFDVECDASKAFVHSCSVEHTINVPITYASSTIAQIIVAAGGLMADTKEFLSVDGLIKCMVGDKKKKKCEKKDKDSCEKKDKRSCEKKKDKRSCEKKDKDSCEKKDKRSCEKKDKRSCGLKSEPVIIQSARRVVNARLATRK